MRTYARDVRPSRTLAQIIQDAMIILGQDRGEYGFIALVGACAAGIVTLMLRLSFGPLGLALAAPLAVIFAALTHGAATAAHRRTIENLDPDAARSMFAVGTAAPAFLRPWLPLAGMLALAALAGEIAGGIVPPTLRPLCVLAIALFCAGYALPRSYHAMALLTHWPNTREAEPASSALVWGSSARVIAAGAVAMGPAILIGLAALLAGFGSVSSAIAACLFVASVPVASIVMAQLFLDAVTRAEQVHVAGMRRPSAAAAAAVRRGAKA